MMIGCGIPGLTFVEFMRMSSLDNRLLNNLLNATHSLLPHLCYSQPYMLHLLNGRGGGDKSECIEMDIEVHAPSSRETQLSRCLAAEGAFLLLCTLAPGNDDFLEYV